jgi:hypothetical protein
MKPNVYAYGQWRDADEISVPVLRRLGDVNCLLSIKTAIAYTRC